MPVTWLLEHDSTTQPLEDWGIDRAVLSRANLDTETLSFSLPLAAGGHVADPVFDRDDVVKLWRDDGGTPVCWFVGKVRQRPWSGSARESRQHYIARNAWHSFTRIVYQQQYVIPNEDNTALLGSWSPRVVLGQNQFGLPMTANAQIAQIAAFANAVGAGLLTLGTLPTWAIPPRETVNNITCAEAIRRLLAYAPDAVGRFTYDGGGTVLTILQRSGLDAVSIDLSSDTHRIEGLDSLDEMADLKPRGVVLIFQTSETVGDDTVLRESRDTAGATTGEAIVFATIGLSPGEAVPTGLATQYYSALSTMHWSGSLRLHERDCSGLLRPGKKLNLTNGRTAWATMDAVVQSTTEDLFSGVTTVELGASERLGLSEFADTMRRFRERLPGGTFPETRHNGTEGTSGQVSGSDPSPGGDLGSDSDSGGAEGGDPDPPGGTQSPNGNGGAPGGALGGAGFGGGFTKQTLTLCEGGEITVLTV